MSFITRPAPPAPGSPNRLQNDGWFPDIDLDALKTQAKIDTTVTAERLREAVQAAVIQVNAELRCLKLARQAEGRASLEAIPAEQVGGESVILATYFRAVHSFASADLVDRLRDINATQAGDVRAEALECTADDLRRNGRWAVSDLLGVGRSTVELI